MAITTTRNVTGISTIPLGTAKAGTVTGETVGGRFYLRGTGTDFNSFLSIARDNDYIFVESDYLLFQVKSVFKDVIEVDQDPTAVSGATFTYVYANLASYTCTNQGSADADFDGAVMEAGVTEQDERTDYNQVRQSLCQAVKIDGSGTDLLIRESL